MIGNKNLYISYFKYETKMSCINLLIITFLTCPLTVSDLRSANILKKYVGWRIIDSTNTLSLDI